jgi:ProP effector
MSKNKRRAAIAAAFALLASTFPKAFVADDLIVRIDGAIQRRELRLALTLYCNSVAYLRNCKVGAERIDLDGNAAGVITAAEAEHASGKLKAKVKKAALATKPQPPPAEAPARELPLIDLKIAARMRKEAAS